MALMSVGAAAVVGLALVIPLASDDVKSKAAPPRYYGVNLPSASFAPKKLPGVHGKDYIYPTAKTAAPFAAMGMNTIRLAVRWERLQPQPFGPLSNNELRLLDKSINELGNFRTIILNIHNFARYHGTALDQPSRSGALADLWTKLAQRYKNDQRIAFGMMNEPHGMSASAWRMISDETLAAIRRTGARNLVLVPGTRWTGGHSWHAGGPTSNAAAMSGYSDPGRNFMFEIHQYLDPDSSGTKANCVREKIAQKRLAKVTQWLRDQKAKAILAEFGVAPTPVCLQSLDVMLQFLKDNGDVWAGWTYWAGGDWWGSYHHSIQPENGPKPQAAVLRRHIESYRSGRN